MSKPLRKKAILASVAAAGVAIAVVAINGAFASHGGPDPDNNAGLTALNGNTVTWGATNPHTLTLTDIGGATPVGNGAWSPDGSRIAIVDSDGFVDTFRFNNGTDEGFITGDQSPNASHPTWTSDAFAIAWSDELGSDTQPSIYWSTSDGGLLPQKVDLVEDGTHTGYSGPDGGPDGVIVLASNNGTGSDVVSITEADLFSQTPVTPTLVVANGSQPSVSPDGTHVAFVRSDGTNNQIFVTDINGQNLVQVTSDAVGHSSPTWSPDSTTIAFNEGSAVFTALADGSQSATPQAANLTGTPAYESAQHDATFRLAGANRFKTATATSQALWATAGNAADPRIPAQAVVISRSDTFADALGGSSLAAAKGGPLLLTPPTSLNADTAAEITRVLGATSDLPVYILGGTSAISTSVENQLKKNYSNVIRLSGANRYATAVKIANEINPNPSIILATTGLNFPDALAAGAAAGSFDVPGRPTSDSAVVVLTADNKLPSDTATYLNGHSGADLWGIGGAGFAAVASRGASPIVGVNRYDTSVGVALVFFGSVQSVGVATGTDWPDSLAGGAAMGTLNGPIVLTTPAALPVPTQNVPFATTSLISLESAAYSQGIVFGGTAAVSNNVLTKLGTLISGPGSLMANVNPTVNRTASGKETAAIHTATAHGRLSIPKEPARLHQQR
ncbi:MAG TPA: cell wall-binding repeat-containing protein [Micromonosporaceae bacterium]|nr:cell wall-binding repeat-containing protein [Micromonosporaceae bacterium]